MAAELESHSGEELVLEVGVATGAEAFVEGGGEDWDGDAFVDGGFDGPTPLAGVADAAGEVGEGGVFDEGVCGEVEEPAGYDAATTPDFGDVGEVEVVLVLLWVAERSGFGINRLSFCADIGIFKDIHAFGVGGHDAVFDAVVDHFNEVTSAVGSAVEVAEFGGALVIGTSHCAGDVADARSEGAEDRVEVLDDFVLAADHHAISALQAPYAAAGSDIHIMDSLGRNVLGAADIVDVVGIAAVDDGVAFFKKREEVVDGGIHRSRWHHKPNGARGFELGNEIREGCRAGRAFFDKGVNGGLRAVEDSGFVAVAKKTEDHIGPHAAEADHTELGHKSFKF